MTYPAGGGSGGLQHVGHGGSHKLVCLVVCRLVRQLGQHPLPAPQQSRQPPQAGHYFQHCTQLLWPVKLNQN